MLTSLPCGQNLLSKIITIIAFYYWSDSIPPFTEYSAIEWLKGEREPFKSGKDQQPREDQPNPS